MAKKRWTFRLKHATLDACTTTLWFFGGGAPKAVLNPNSATARHWQLRRMFWKEDDMLKVMNCIRLSQEHIREHRGTATASELERLRDLDAAEKAVKLHIECIEREQDYLLTSIEQGRPVQRPPRPQHTTGDLYQDIYARLRSEFMPWSNPVVDSYEAAYEACQKARPDGLPQMREP